MKVVSESEPAVISHCQCHEIVKWRKQRISEMDVVEEKRGSIVQGVGNKYALPNLMRLALYQRRVC